MIVPAGTTLNPQTGLCQANPTCPSETAYNPTTNRCKAPHRADGACPFGYPVQSGNVCINPATNPCPAGTALDPVTDRCE